MKKYLELSEGFDCRETQLLPRGCEFDGRQCFYIGVYKVKSGRCRNEIV